MIRNCLFCVLLTLFGCAHRVGTNTDKSPSPDTAKAISVSPAMHLAKVITEQENLSAELRREFTSGIDLEKKYWQEELAKVLSGKELEQAVVELRTFEKRLEQRADVLTSNAILTQRISEFLAASFTENELKTIAQFMESSEWKKYQQVMSLMRFSPDTLGLRAEFTKILDEERIAMATRVFGAEAVKQSASNSSP